MFDFLRRLFRRHADEPATHAQIQQAERELAMKLAASPKTYPPRPTPRRVEDPGTVAYYKAIDLHTAKQKAEQRAVDARQKSRLLDAAPAPRPVRRIDDERRDSYDASYLANPLDIRSPLNPIYDSPSPSPSPAPDCSPPPSTDSSGGIDFGSSSSCGSDGSGW